jgi:hypothetical protein
MYGELEGWTGHMASHYGNNNLSEHDAFFKQASTNIRSINYGQKKIKIG